MTQRAQSRRKPSCFFLLLCLITGLAFVICLQLTFYRPDRPVPHLIPGSSSGPNFIIQIIRPRSGIPLGGLIPPSFFEVDPHLGFDASTENARATLVTPSHIEIRAKNWTLNLVRDEQGRLTSATEVVFDLKFEERLRTVRCRPADPVEGTMELVVLEETNELAGSFAIELTYCEDAETGASLGWPPQPLILHGSFDRLPQD